MTQETNTTDSFLPVEPSVEQNVQKKRTVKKPAKQPRAQLDLPPAQPKNNTERSDNVVSIAALPFTKVAETIQNHISQQHQALFSENVKLSKDFFKCKTVNDLFELQSRIFHLNSSAYLNNIVKLTESFVKTK